jgi:2-oxoglutarate dehydrogenase E2 component (dihydrolipoamide succinyltransferase)
MKNEIKVPSLGESISEAIIGTIIAPTGTIVKADAEILELETDKVNQVIYAPQTGRITLDVKSGDAVKIGQTIGNIESAQDTEEKTVETSQPSPSKVHQQTTETSKAVELSVVQPPSPQETPIRYTKEAFLTDLKATGKPLQQESISTPEIAAPNQSKQQITERETRRPLSKIRKVIAQRLVEAQRKMAMLTTFNEVDLTQIIQLREKYKDEFAKKYGCKLGFMSFFVEATLSALKAFPDFNSYIDGDDIVHREYYDIGVAVGTDRGVIVPVIRNCDLLSYAEIEQAIENYAKKAREGGLTADDLQGGGFTITNGGVYGSLLSTPILLSPQCGILGMHKIEKRPIVINDQIAIRSMMYLALSYDHRLIDGKDAVSFLVHIKNMLEDSSRLLLEI